MHELVSADRQNPKDQTRIGRYDDLQEAIAEMHRRKQIEPTRAFYIFVYFAPFCRILTGHSLW
jgi:hypothetical protein